MYARSTNFDAAIVKSHIVVTRADLYVSNVYQTSLTLTDGNVTVQDDSIRRRFNVRMQDPTGAMVPTTLSSLLSPGGAEVKLFRGIQYADSTTELLPLGFFGISRYRLDDSGQSMSVQLEGFDRARRVQRAKLSDDYVITSGQDYVTAIQTLWQNQWPPIQFKTTTLSGFLTPNIVLGAGKDPWGEGRRLLGNIGWEAFFDADGLCVIQPVQAQADLALWNLVEGSNAAVLSLTKMMDDEDFANHCVVTGESSQNTAPVRAEAKDTDPSSPTYIGGPMGDVVDYFTASEISSVPQAQSVATARLTKRLGIPLGVEIIGLVQPAMDIDDPILIQRARSGLNELFTASKVTIPMVSQRGMNLSTRQKLVGV